MGNIWRGIPVFLSAAILISGAVAASAASQAARDPDTDHPAAIPAADDADTVLTERDMDDSAVLTSTDAAILIDNQEVSGTVAIAAGEHVITARAESDRICIAVYENQKFVTMCFGKTLSYHFPDSGTEIGLYCFDSVFRPVREPVRVVQGAASQRLVYSGQAWCYSDEDGDFNDYIVRLKVVTKDGQIMEIKDIEGYTFSGKATDSTNRYYLRTAAAEIPGKIITKQSADIPDAVSGATCASQAIKDAVKAALKTTPEAEPDDPSGGVEDAIPDGVYAGSAQCLTGNINYIIDLAVTVRDGVITGITDRTLNTPMSSKDKALYAKAWTGIADSIAKARFKANAFHSVDAVSGATVSSAGIASAIQDALSTQTAAENITGERYAPEGISLYARLYPVVTIENGKIKTIKIIPASDTDEDKIKLLETFAGEIIRNQSVTGLTYPDAVKDDAFAVANLTDQILYGKGVLR